MRNYKLPRTGDEPLRFLGERIVGQDFTDEQDIYLDAQGKLQIGRHVYVMSFNCFRTDDGRLVYQGLGRSTPPCGTDISIARFITPKEHRQVLKTMEEMRRNPYLKAGPLRLPNA